MFWNLEHAYVRTHMQTFAAVGLLNETARYFLPSWTMEGPLKKM